MKYLTTLALALFASITTINAQDWEQVASLPDNYQTDHSFAFALNGYGYILTGYNSFGFPTNDMYRYDASTDEWTQIDDFPGGSRGYAIGEVYDGKAYFGFGTDGVEYFDDFWVFDPEDESWTELEQCACPGRIHPAMVGANGTISVGLGNSDFNMNDWWVYDIDSDEWTQGQAFPASARHHPYQFGIGDYAYAGFGHGNGFISNKWYRYDPANDEWDQMEDLPDEGRVAGTQFSHNGKGYALSGEGESHTAMSTGEFWEYDPDNDSWTQLPSHPGASRWAPASFVLNGEVYLINGPIRSSFTSIYQSAVYKFALDEFVSVRENSMEEGKLDVFPNPATDMITINHGVAYGQAADFTISVYDTSMQLIDQTSEYSNQYDVSELSSGLYLFQVRADNKVYTARVLVE